MFPLCINCANDKPREARGTTFLFLSDRQKMNLEHRVCISPVFYPRKILRRKFLFRSRGLFVLFLFPLPLSLVGETASTCSARNALKSGRHDVTRDFLLSSNIYTRSYPCDNAKCTHRLTCGRNASEVDFRI